MTDPGVAKSIVHWLAHDITAAILMAGNRAEIRLTSTAWALVPLGRRDQQGPQNSPTHPRCWAVPQRFTQPAPFFQGHVLRSLNWRADS
jgi:hypothetical protein